MASSTRIPPTEITGIYGAVLKSMSRRMLGQVPDAAGVMWHYPRLLRDAMGFGRTVDSWNRLNFIETAYALADQSLRVTRRLALALTQGLRSLVTA